MSKLPLLVAVFVAFFSSSLTAYDPPTQEKPCDNRLVKAAGTLGYQIRERGIRCEGLFINEPISEGGLEIVSYMRGRLKYAFDIATVMHIAIPGIGDMTKEPVNIRATTIPRKPRYRMDAVLDSLPVIRWPVRDVLYKAAIKAEQVGVYGWIGSEDRKIYVPLQINSGSRAPVSSEDSLFLRIRPPMRIAHLEYSIYMAKDKSPVVPQTTVVSKLTFAGVPVDIPIPSGEAADLLIRIRAREYKSDRWLPILTARLLRPRHE